MRTIAVIGAAFGDEGKGRMVDHFASLAPSVVVRYNGGAQAAHTVIGDDGKPHVFRHFGAGSFCGAPTFLSRFFICNPFLWAHEYEAMPAGTRLFVDPAAPLTTPYDMLINREIEQQRGTAGKRHGTCGLGIGETVGRLVAGTCPTFVGDILDGLEDRLAEIRKVWVPKRVAEMPGKPSDWFLQQIDRREPLDKFIADAKRFHKTATLTQETCLQGYRQVIFEGAQGLCLDEDHMFFPHVTRSRTGLSNVAAICARAGIKDVEAVYTTRAYTTRHGDGPFPSHDPDMAFDDPTNVANDYQGVMRFGALDLDLIREAVRIDLTKGIGLNVSVSAALTCVDQVGESVPVRQNGRRRDVHRDDLGRLLCDAVNASRLYLSASRGRKR